MSKTDEKRREEQGNREILAPGRKRPYRSPEFRRLGSVADLTLGNGATGADARSPKRAS
jgi:hypothetical protein